MAFQPVIDTAEIDVIYTLNNKTVQNSFYAKLLGGYNLTDLQAMANAIDLQVSGSWKAQQPPEAVYLRTEVRGLAVENDLIAEQNAQTGPGIQPTKASPNQVTFSVKKTSGLTGRSARGRTYWIGVPTGQLQITDENLVNPVWASDVVAAVGDIRETINMVGTWVAVLVSRFQGGVQRPFGETFTWVGEVNVDLRVDTLRGRLPVL